MPRSVIIGGALLLLLAVAYEVYSFRYRDAEDAVLCRSLYQHAKTAADTGRIDVQFAPRARGRGEFSAPNLTCGALRHTGRIR